MGEAALSLLTGRGALTWDLGLRLLKAGHTGILHDEKNPAHSFGSTPENAEVCAAL